MSAATTKTLDDKAVERFACPNCGAEVGDFCDNGTFTQCWDVAAREYVLVRAVCRSRIDLVVEAEDDRTAAEVVTDPYGQTIAVGGTFFDNAGRARTVGDLVRVGENVWAVYPLGGIAPVATVRAFKTR